MQLENLQAGFLALWDCGELEKAAATDKLVYRMIGGRKFQFRKVDFKQRTALSIEIMAVTKALMPIFGKAQALAGEDATAEDIAFLDLLPDLIGALATPNLQALVDKLNATASVDLGNEKFEPLADDIVGERAFGADITLQIPVAITAAEVNLDTLFSKVANMN